MNMLWRKDIIAQLVDVHLELLSQNKPIYGTNVSGVLRFEFASTLAQSDLLFKTNCWQTLVVKENNKLNDTIAQLHMFIIRQFMLLFLSKDQTISHLGLSELLVIMSKNDHDVTFQRATGVTCSSLRAVCVGHWTLHHMESG